MRPRAVISALLVCLLAFAPDGLAAPKKGRRIEAGPSYLEPLQVRDSVLVLDQFRY